MALHWPERHLSAQLQSLLGHLRQTGRLNLYLVIALSSLVCCLMLEFRLQYFDSPAYAFLGGNLVLAIIPFAVSQWLVVFPSRRVAVYVAAGVIWLLFFPNAPYILTDVAHVTRNRPPVPPWFDLMLLLSFAWNGLMLGFLSLLDMQAIVERRFGRNPGWAFAASAIVLASFGIYIGRFLRWSSWSIITHPAALITDVASRLFHPVTYPEAYGVTVLFSLFLLLGYTLLRSLIQLGLPAVRSLPSDVRRSP